ncbi:hypothetical protein LINGRAHAP2_LOCUS6613, partial [Linum grandiflorum]
SHFPLSFSTSFSHFSCSLETKQKGSGRTKPSSTKGFLIRRTHKAAEMGAVLIELEQSLRSQKEYLTSQEAELLQFCKNRALRTFTFTSLVGGSAAWGATWRLSRIPRVYIAGGAAFVMGLLGFNRSLENSVQHILSRDQSHLQRELASIMVMKHGHAPWARRLLSKRFYMETVFDDSSPTEVNVRWRYRNHSGQGIPNDRLYRNNPYHKDSGDQKPHDNEKSQAESDIKTVDVKPKQVNASPQINSKSHHAEITEDPIDSIFGAVAPLEEIHHPATPAPATRAQHRSHRRSHRARRRMRHHEAPM